jgi:hypothetical protein
MSIHANAIDYSVPPAVDQRAESVTLKAPQVAGLLQTLVDGASDLTESLRIKGDSSEHKRRDER